MKNLKSQKTKKTKRIKNNNERFSEKLGTLKERKEERKRQAGRRIAKDRQGV